MNNQLELDRLRQTYSARLEAFINEARKTELLMQQLKIPVRHNASRQFLFQRRAEVEAYETYLLASMRLSDFLEQQSHRVN